MKRSEMLVYMQRVYGIRHVMVETGHLTLKDFMDELLQYMEGKGMLPPYSGSDPISTEALGDFGENACTADHVCGCEWEKET